MSLTTNSNHKIKGVILVGGPSVGTRFRPLSMDCPKPLFPVAGKAMIYHHVAALAKLPAMREILLIGFFENSILDRFLTEIALQFPHVTIRYLREYQSLGTAGGLFHFRDEICRGNPSHFFVLNADIASSFPLKEMLTFHENRQGVSTLLSIRVDRSHVSNFGCVVADSETQEVLHFVEKPESSLSDMISCGIYLFNPQIFEIMGQAIAQRRSQLREDGQPTENLRSMDILERIQLESDVLSLMASTKKLYSYVCVPGKDFWMQIKTGSSVIPANRLYLQHFLRVAPRRLSVPNPAPSDDVSDELAADAKGPEIIQPAHIHPTALICPTAKLGPNVSIGPRALIGRGVRIRDSVILDNVEVKNDSCVLNSVIGWDSKIGQWARIEGAPVESSHLNATVKGYKIPSATILGKDVTIGDEITVRNCIVLPHKDIKTSQHNEILM